MYVGVPPHVNVAPRWPVDDGETVQARVAPRGALSYAFILVMFLVLVPQQDALVSLAARRPSRTH
jgi:hypothetical protein